MSNDDIYLTYGSLMLAVVLMSVVQPTNMRPRPDRTERRYMAVEWELACMGIMGRRAWFESRNSRYGKFAERLDRDYEGRTPQ